MMRKRPPDISVPALKGGMIAPRTTRFSRAFDSGYNRAERRSVDIRPKRIKGGLPMPFGAGQVH